MLPCRLLRTAGLAVCVVACVSFIASAALIQVSFPLPGDVVQTGTLVAAEVDASFPRDQVAGVRFEFSSDQIHWFVIPGTAPKGFEEFSTLWYAVGYSGPFYLRAILRETNGRAVLSVPVQVFVNQQPVPRAILTPLAQPYKVHYDATSSSDADGSIVSFDWSFSDGGSASGPVIDHQFSGGGVFGVALTVTDDRGGTATRHTELAISLQGFMKEKEKTTCGCKSLTVKTTDGVEGPNDLSLSGYVISGETRKLGAYNDGEPGDQLDFSLDAFSVRNRFEVIAVLDDLSKPQLCEEGQRVQATSSDGKGGSAKWSGVFSSDPRYDYRAVPPARATNNRDPFNPADDPKKLEQGKCGFGDDKWCDDDYHGGGGPRGNGKASDDPPNRKKRYEAETRILWVDAPGIKGIRKTTLQAFGYFEDDKYEAIVTGPNGKAGDKGFCRCGWEVHIAVDKKGKVTRNEVSNLDCIPK
jgi:hypothetical protein